MSVPEDAPVPAPDMRAMLKELQAEAILPLLPCITAIGALLPLAARQSHSMHAASLGLALILLTIVVWLVRKTSKTASVWILTTGLLLVDLLMVGWTGIGPAIYLLTIPTGLAALSLGMGSGVAMAAACTLILVFSPQAPLPADPELRTMAICGVWSTVGLIWLTRRPLATTLQWSWSSYEQCQRLLERARDYQVQLKQTLADLADANLQLTRLNRLTDSLRHSAEESREAKERFVANVSHELRTPLNMIIGFSEMMLQAPSTYGANLPKALLADLAIILRNSQHLSSLIDDVLDLSQVETGRMALSKERVHISEIVAAATAAVRPLFRSKGLQLETEVPEDLPPILCDRTRIREVLLNLLSNAGRYTECGGVRVGVRREGHSVVFSVADTGPGIANEDKNRIFLPFFQLDGSIRRRHGGSGLGLSISKSFVDLHGGQMWVESEKGIGTTFYFRLPIDPIPPTTNSVARWFSPYWHYEERTQRSLAPASIVQPRYVVWESGDSLQRLLTRYLDNAEIVSNDTLDEALQAVTSVPAQALLINGSPVAEMLQRLNEVKLPHGLPVIICSLPGAEEAAGALGVSSYLVKPISREVLLSALDRLPSHPRTVLIVDDEPEALQLFWRMLASSGRGYRVLTATEGREALSILHEEQPDAILLDLAMPEMDGFQLLEVRNQDPALRNIPVIVTSARDPAGQSFVTGTVAVVQGGGLSTAQFLACIQGVSAILSAGSPPGDPKRKEKHLDSQASA